MYKHILLVVFLLFSSSVWADNYLKENKVVTSAELLMEGKVLVQNFLDKLKSTEDGHSVDESFIDIRVNEESGKPYIHDIRVDLKISGVKEIWEVSILRTDNFNLLMEGKMLAQNFLDKLESTEDGYSVGESIIDFRLNEESGKPYIHDIRVNLKISGIKGMWEVSILRTDNFDLLMEGKVLVQNFLDKLESTEDGHSVGESFIEIRLNEESGKSYIHEIMVNLKISGIKGMWEVSIFK